MTLRYGQVRWEIVGEQRMTLLIHGKGYNFLTNLFSVFISCSSVLVKTC